MRQFKNEKVIPWVTTIGVILFLAIATWTLVGTFTYLGPNNTPPCLMKNW